MKKQGKKTAVIPQSWQSKHIIRSTKRCDLTRNTQLFASNDALRWGR